MWRRPVVTILMLIIAVILTLPLPAQQKPFTQEQVSNMVRDGFGDESAAKLIEQRGIDFAPSEDFYQTLKAAGASEALPNALRAAVAPGLSPAHAALKGGSTTAGPPAGAKKPLNQVQVFALLAGGVPSHRVTMLVQERGIDFEPTDDYLQEVRLAGGEAELISALKSAKVTKPATVDPAAQARQAEIRRHVARGAEFEQKRRYAEAEQEFRAALLFDSQNADLYASLAYVLNREEKWEDSAAAARQALRVNPENERARDFLVLAHTGRGLALEKKGDLDGAIAEYHEALRLDPKNELGHTDLGGALEKKGDIDGAVAEYRVALRLNPNNAVTHFSLGGALEEKNDLDGGVAEYREAIRLMPNFAMAHVGLGIALGEKGDLDGAIREYREVLRLDPNDAEAHVYLGGALGDKGDPDGEIAEYREALRLDPNHDRAHNSLGFALRQKGDLDGAIMEYREALRLNPNNDKAHNDLAFTLGQKGDLDGMISEERQALRLNPNNDMAHVGLGLALGGKGDNDGMIAEEREALRLNPNKGLAHAALGDALGKKGDLRGALEEYRAAYMLDPKNVTYKQAYERLLQRVNQ